MTTLRSIQSSSSNRASSQSASQAHYRDISGYVLFSDGAEGDAHVFAHCMLDQERYGLGHQMLGLWLAQRRGDGSQWVHLQWHMALFELAVVGPEAALTRYNQHILPAVIATEDALTDAPTLLWRLSLATGEHASLPWEPVRRRALSRMQRRCGAYVQLHNLLALAGAGDLIALREWLSRSQPTIESHGDQLARRFGEALYAYLLGNLSIAVQRMGSVVSRVDEIGGSHAQNQFFHQLYQFIRHREESGYLALGVLKVA